MSEELIQKNLVEAPEKMGDWNFYNIGATTLKALKGAKSFLTEITMSTRQKAGCAYCQKAAGYCRN